MNKKSRRNVLKGLAVGAPIVWAKPVVDSVLLPAHALSSCDLSGCFLNSHGDGSYRIIDGYLIHYRGTVPCQEGNVHSDGRVVIADTMEEVYEELDCETQPELLSSFTDYSGACTVWWCVQYNV